MADTLNNVLDKIGDDKLAKKEEESIMIMGVIKQIAERYWTLEAKTKRSVCEIKCYGEDLKQAAEDFIEDGIIKDFWKEMSNTT